jgi:hypothetical protein
MEIRNLMLHIAYYKGDAVMLSILLVFLSTDFAPDILIRLIYLSYISVVARYRSAQI